MKFLIILAAVLGIVAVGSANSFATTDIYMKYGSIPGNVLTQGYTDFFQVDSMGFHITKPVSIGGTGGAGSGAPQFSAITITKPMDSVSPLLMQQLLQGSIGSQTATIDLVKNTGTGKLFTYGEYTLTNPIVTSYDVSTGGDVPSETYTIQFEKFSFKFTPQNPDGTIGTTITQTWDLTTNLP